MGDNTKIEWADATWNPLIGCSKVGPGCDNCYAIGAVHRGMAAQHRGLTVHTEGAGTDWTGEVREVRHLLDQPIRQRRPRRIFVNSLSDLFHPSVSVEFIAEVFATMALSSHHTFQVLTKRAQRMASVLSDPAFVPAVEAAIGRYPAKLQANALCAYPFPNVWLGVSIETDQYTFRADHLRDTPAAVRWISAEPLLGPLPSLDLTGIDWLVVGGESGPGSRPLDPTWVRDLYAQCTAPAPKVTDPHLDAPDGAVLELDDGTGRTIERHRDEWVVTAQPAFLFKQAGAVLAAEWGMSDRKGGNFAEMPDEPFLVREYPRGR